MIVLVGPYVGNATQRSHALSYLLRLCFTAIFCHGYIEYLHAVGDAEHISKNTVCRAIRKVVVALNTLLIMFVAFPIFLSTQIVKDFIHFQVKENLCLRELVVEWRSVLNFCVRGSSPK